MPRDGSRLGRVEGDSPGQESGHTWPRRGLSTFRRSFKRQTSSIRSIFQAESIVGSEYSGIDYEAPPGWALRLNELYRRYGLRHFFLLFLFSSYLCMGALLFQLCERSHDILHAQACRDELERARNKSAYAEWFLADYGRLSWASGKSSVEELAALRDRGLELARIVLAITTREGGDGSVDKCGREENRWDSFSKALLYSLFVCSAMGYRHITPRTLAGKCLTLVYALFGIPLLICTAIHAGDVLARAIIQLKRMLKHSCCMAEEDRENSDGEEAGKAAVPTLPSTIFALVGWTVVCSLVHSTFFRTNEAELLSDCLPASLYFFFLTFSTIGVDDQAPVDEHQAFFLIVAIIVGLSLVSVLLRILFALNIGQRRRGTNRTTASQNANERPQGSEAGKRTWSAGTSNKHRQKQQHRHETREMEALQSRSSQTALSFPVCKRTSALSKAVNSGQESNSRLFPTSTSIDDVMRLVDTEEGDIVVLTEMLSREESSGISEIISSLGGGGDRSQSSSGTVNVSMGVASTSTGTYSTSTSSSSTSTMITARDETQPHGPPPFPQRAITPAQQPLAELDATTLNSMHVMTHHALSFPSVLTSSLAAERRRQTNKNPATTLSDLELIEELEDRMLLTSSSGDGGASSLLLDYTPTSGTSGIQFRSRLSLIPEHHSCSNSRSSNDSFDATDAVTAEDHCVKERGDANKLGGGKRGIPIVIGKRRKS